MTLSLALCRMTPALLLALALPARAAQFEGKAAQVPVVPAVSAAGPSAPVLSGASSLPAIPSLAAPALNAGATLPGAAAVPSLPAAALPGAGASVTPGAAKASLSAPAGGEGRGEGPKAGADAGAKKSIEGSLGETGKALAPELEAAARGDGDPKSSGDRIERILEGGKPTRHAPEAVAVGGARAFMPAALRNRLPNPRDLYETARSLAVEEGRRLGSESVAFGEVTASMPAGEQRTLHFSFYALVDGGRRAKPILVTMTADHLSSPSVPYSASLRSWNETMTLDRPLFPQLSQPYYFKRGSEADPELALGEARRALPALGAGVSFTLRLEEVPATGEVDLWYRFYDNAGSQVAVNSRTGETVVAHDASTHASVDHVIGRKTVDVLGSLAAGAALFPAGSAVAQHWQINPYSGYLAAWLGALLLGSLLKALPWASVSRLGRVIGVGAIFSPVLAFAFVGVKALAASLGLAAAVAGSVKNAPAGPLDGGLPAMYASALEAAQKAAVQAKLPAPEFAAARRSAEGWSFDFKAGDRLVIAFLGQQGRASAYAYGAFEPPFLGLSKNFSAKAFKTGARYSARTALKASAAKLGVPEEQLGLSLIVHVDARTREKDLWYVSDTEDGRRFGVNARSRALHALESGPSRADVQASADGTASYKGRPWSQTEYNMQLSGAMDHLRRLGATVAQMELFRRITAAHPVRGGGFNPYSGD